MFISIITPVYNRAELIHNLYDSLINQKNYDFEWVIVNDGSTDNIEHVVEEFKKKSPFPINFISKENGGKPSAVNIGVIESRCDWVLIIDSDDELSKNGMSIIVSDIIQVNDPACAGLIYLKAYTSSGGVVGDYFKTARINNTNLASIKGDKAIVIKRNLLLNHLFPVFPFEKFITEAYAWNRILDSYYLKGYNKVIYLCEYLEGGLTHNYKQLLEKNKNGTLCFVSSNLSLRTKSLSIYKQSIYHFIPIMNSENIMFLKRRLPKLNYYIFILLLRLFFFKRKIIEVLNK